jgi:large subunit ribosomal protein L24
MRGGYAGHAAKVTSVDTKRRAVYIEKVTSVKADGKETPRPIHPSNVLVTKLDLTDPWRKKKLEEMSK